MLTRSSPLRILFIVSATYVLHRSMTIKRLCLTPLPMSVQPLCYTFCYFHSCLLIHIKLFYHYHSISINLTLWTVIRGDSLQTRHVETLTGHRRPGGDNLEENSICRLWTRGRTYTVFKKWESQVFGPVDISAFYKSATQKLVSFLKTGLQRAHSPNRRF